jgi:hypothetical protein
MISVGTGVEKWKPWCTINGKVNCCSYYIKQSGDIIKILK